ncbi:mechanosensitive ion channel family protein [Algiphilus aromaticivorans]|uniref:mechanosensitive ion channel family protein n=1 Tax=Algiphilus aromaticivorans TaxID=382454 RepID=UPI000A001609|nr:mechanosensitive ion channel domain-containing protein [Algiphilus aromaticivorans]
MAISLENFTDPVALVNLALPLAVNVLSALLVFFIGKWVARKVIDVVQRNAQKRNMDPTLVRFLGNVVYGLALAVIVIAALGRLGVDTTSAAALLAGAGLAVGLALQGQISSFAAGVMIILFRPFRVGDFVEVAGQMGTVEDIKIVITTLKSLDNQLVTIPNNAVWSGVITNYSALPTRRVDLLVSISYAADLKRAKALLHEILAAEDRMLEDPSPTVVVTNLGDNSVDFAARGHTTTGEWWATRCDLIERIKLRFDEEGIEIPYPQMDVHVRDMAPMAANG